MATREQIQEWRLAKAIECLKWYGDRSNWMLGTVHYPKTVFAVRGEYARMVLEEIDAVVGEGFDEVQN